ncbi:MAG: membrane protein insertion efficiency factor YidD [Endomicrobium sp.]|jgi:putative membrane protein insertion efficiency factor|nr:membrane protein insertion efficiency factor YidD [Endomicrobium sp.]MDR2645032.1 membrane protein insertion efficiency factor YidD [Endomicrobium sp.]
MRFFALFLIKYYKFVSKILPARCRFYPTCSTYAYQAIEMYGFFKGSFLAFKRIIRCNPFCNGGLDPVPVIKKKK